MSADVVLADGTSAPQVPDVVSPRVIVTAAGHGAYAAAVAGRSGAQGWKDGNGTETALLGGRRDRVPQHRAHHGRGDCRLAFGQLPAIIVRDYGSVIATVVFLMAFWAVAYNVVLERTAADEEEASA